MPSTRHPRHPASRRQLLQAIVALSTCASWALPGIVWAGDAVSTTPWPLWVVEKAGAKVYLTGQTPPRATAWADARMESLVLQCGAIWTETNHLHRKDDKPQPGNLMHSGKSLVDQVSAADAARLKQALDVVKLPMDQIAKWRPWVAAMTIEGAGFQAANLDVQGTAESVLLRIANMARIVHRSEFPTQEDTVEFMGQMSEREDVQFLQYVLDRVLAGSEENERIHSAWARGDMVPASEFVANMKRTQPDLYARHVVARNRNWLPRFAAMQTEAKPSMVIVGLFHMVGPDSLPEQLKANGWRVRLA